MSAPPRRLRQLRHGRPKAAEEKVDSHLPPGTVGEGSQMGARQSRTSAARSSSVAMPLTS